MICPTCGFQNQEGRKYCRSCAKALAAPPAAQSEPELSEPESFEQLAESTPIEAPAVDSSYDALLADLPTERSFEPISSSSSASGPGISRNVIAIAAVLVVVIGGAAFWFLHKGGDDAGAQTAQTQNPVANAAHQPDPAAQKTREQVVSALRLIVAQQEARLADDPDDLNVCAVNVFGNDDLGRHVRDSHYIYDQQCQPQTSDGRAIRNGFTITATPKVEDNSADAPTYCVDQTKIIRRYADSSAVNNATSVQHLTCPLDGQPLQ